MERLRDHGRAVWVLAATVASAAAVVLGGCSLGPKPDIDRGQQLFSQKCGSCHTLTGAGTNANVGPNLDYAFKQARANGMDSDTIAGVVKAQVENPRPASPQQTEVYMPSNLVEGNDLEDVAAYIASVAGVPGIRPPVFQPPSFFASNCGGCHKLAVAGTTGTTGPDLTTALRGQSVNEVMESISNPQAKITPGYPSGVMPANFGQTLTPDQLRSLSSYLLGMGPSGGTSGGGRK